MKIFEASKEFKMAASDCFFSRNKYKLRFIDANDHWLMYIMGGEL